jgi:hypothetical protein
MCGWPRSVFDWDVLFLLPLPWWGPVLAPVSIAVLMIVWGTIVSLPRERLLLTPVAATIWCLSTTGITLALASLWPIAAAIAAVEERHGLRPADGVRLARVLRRARADGCSADRSRSDWSDRVRCGLTPV